MKLQYLSIFATSLKGNKMNNMLKSIVYILFFLLFIMIVGQDHYTLEPTNCHSNTPCYQQQPDPCKKTVDFLFTNNFADMPQMAISLDNPSTSKFKCIARLLTMLSEINKQELQTNNIICHSSYSLHANAVDYYIYALRRIII